jgi:hypothetical protein
MFEYRRMVWWLGCITGSQAGRFLKFDYTAWSLLQHIKSSSTTFLKKFLVALSGGGFRRLMVLTLLHQHKGEFWGSHCNFNLQERWKWPGWTICLWIGKIWMFSS